LDSISLTLDLNNFNFVEMIENGEGSVISGEGTTNFKIQIPGKSVRVYKIYSN
jgi:hypothetical protein